MVEHGETIQITDHGRPVALLSPLPEGSPLERLRAAGETQPPDVVGIGDLPRPLESRASELPSTVLARLRRNER